jgi:hypothetical protein
LEATSISLLTSTSTL